jgi:drug/metabolite transporter (DMT)-like permease
MTYATYARRGFFELVAVVVLAGGLLLGLESLVARRPRAYVAAALALVGLTSVVLASSFVRLRLYQEAYGWTELRFYVLAAMVFLACCLAAAAVLIASGRSRWLPHAVAASSLVVLVLVNVVGPQAYITDRNLERVLVPSAVPDYGESRLDAAYLGSFGADAIPALVAALPRLTDAQRERLMPVLATARERYVQGADPAWQAANIARARARETLEALFGVHP